MIVIKRLAKAISFVGLFFLLATSACISFHSLFIGETYKEVLNPLVIALISILQISLFVKLRKKITPSPKRAGRLAIIITLASFLFLILSGIIFFGQSYLDLAYLESEAANLVNSDTISNTEYFSVYNNNFFFLSLLAHAFRIANIIKVNPLYLCLTISAICVSSCFYFCYLSTKKLRNNRDALFVLITLATNPLFYLYVSHFYTDIVILPVTYGALYLMTSIAKAKKTDRKIWIHYLLLGALFVLGMKIRPTIIVIFAAFGVFYLAKLLKRRHLIGLFFGATGCAIALLGVNLVSSPFKLDYDKDATFPSTHWLMMGANIEHDGAWSQADYDLTNEQPSYKAKQQKNLSILKERILSMSPAQFLSFSSQKLKRNWASGHHAYNVYSDITREIYPITDWLNGSRKAFVFYILQAGNTVAWVAFPLIIIIDLLKKRHRIDFWNLSMAGAIAFYLAWETAPRYSFSFVPLLYVLAFSRFGSLVSCVKTAKIKLNSKIQISFTSLLKPLRIGALALTICLIVFGFYHFAVARSYRNIRAVHNTAQNGPLRIIQLAGEQELQQSFSSNLKFNRIVIKPARIDETRSGKLFVRLLDSNNEEVYRYETATSRLKDNSAIAITLPKILPAGKDYTLSVSSDYSLSLYRMMKSGVDFYPEGEMSLDSNLVNGDLFMTISLYQERPIVSKRAYIAISLAILLAELWAFDLVKLRIRKK